MGRPKGVKTLHPLLATISTPIAAPVIAGIRLRRGSAHHHAHEPPSTRDDE